MKTKFLLVITVLLSAFTSYAQNDLNNYKYIIVPNKFEFQKEDNAYNLNKLSQFLFNKYGFEALMEGDEYPVDLATNGCLGLQSDVLKEPGMFKTKLKVVLKDCSGKTVYTSGIGESREKEYYVAYNKAIRMAFSSFENLNYNYRPSENQNKVSKPKPADKENEIEALKKEIETLKKITESEKGAAKEVKTIATEEETVTTPEVEEVIKKENAPILKSNVNPILYAQATNEGFQIVDNTPKVVMLLIASPLNNVFIVKDKNAIVFKKDGNWFYSEDSKSAQKLNLKF